MRWYKTPVGKQTIHHHIYHYMKRIFIILLPAVMLAAVSCTKKLPVDMPSLTISLDPARQVADTFVYKLGDTTNFIFTGSAANIAFYPGDAGRAYDNRNRVQALGAAGLSFFIKSGIWHADQYIATAGYQ